MNTSKLDRYDLKHYSRLFISFFLSLTLLSIYQYTTLYFKGMVEIIFGSSFFIAVLHHLGFASITALGLLLPFNFFENLRPKYGFRLVFGILILLLILESALISYYLTALVPLGSDLLGYSFADMKETINNSGGISFLPILGLLAVLVIFWGLFKLSSRYYNRIVKMYPFTIILFSLFVAAVFVRGKPINFNKTQYLAVNLYNSSTEDISYKSDEEFPLIKSQSSKNVLGPFFELKEEKPNIVFIVVEGLGRDFVGEGAEFGGFTPFLDSLSTKSLYWENFLSSSGRTFGVLPTIMGSLPFGKSGFMELETFPNKLTLFSVLKNNGYHSSFYQGSSISFDNVDKFLLSEGLDFILDKSSFGNQYELQAGDASGFSWGYPDMELFKKSMSVDRSKNQPRFEVYMTISNHEPFIPPNKDYYEAQVNKILPGLNHDNTTVRVMKKNKNVFATLLYTDDAIKYAIESYADQPNYENTIFVITGDHRLIPIPKRNNLSRFHVPLIVYSPLLKNARKMSSISSHFDLAPTLLSLLDNSYEMKMPKKVAWLGSDIDTTIAFQSIKDIPLMRNKNELKEFISGDKLFSAGSSFTIDENMDLNTAFSDNGAENKLDAFKAMNAYVTANNKIIPDSLAIFSIKKERFSESEMVWLNSLHNGYNSDKYFLIARKLAFKDEYDKALLVCRYIISERPWHLDTKLLMGRINAWRGNRDLAIEIFKECININPEYVDSYSALFDVYFWDSRHDDALQLIETAKQNNTDLNILTEKISRAKREAKKAGKYLTKIQSEKTEDMASLENE